MNTITVYKNKYDNVLWYVFQLTRELGEEIEHLDLDIETKIMWGQMVGWPVPSSDIILMKNENLKNNFTPMYNVDKTGLLSALEQNVAPKPVKGEDSPEVEGQGEDVAQPEKECDHVADAGAYSLEALPKALTMQGHLEHFNAIENTKADIDLFIEQIAKDGKLTYMQGKCLENLTMYFYTHDECYKNRALEIMGEL